jgi:hypothetical protein
MLKNHRLIYFFAKIFIGTIKQYNLNMMKTFIMSKMLREDQSLGQI